MPKTFSVSLIESLEKIKGIQFMIPSKYDDSTGYFCSHILHSRIEQDKVFKNFEKNVKKAKNHNNDDSEFNVFIFDEFDCGTMKCMVIMWK